MMLNEFLWTIISHALSDEKLSVRIVQVIFALGVALVFYSKYIFSSLMVILLCLAVLLIVFMVARVFFANFINDLLLRVFIEEVTKSDSGTAINIEELIGFLEDILFKNRSIIDDIPRHIQRFKVFKYLGLIAPSVSLFFIYVLGLYLILFIFKPSLSFSDILYIGISLIIISFTILMAQGELELEPSQSDRSALSLSTPIINTSSEVTRKYIYGNIRWRTHKSLLLLMTTLARLLPTFKIESVRPMHLVRLYVCEQGSNNQGYSLDNLINNWLNKDKDDVYFKLIKPERKDDSPLSICDPRNVIKNVNTLTMSPYEFLNIISGKDNRGKPIIMKLVRKNKDGSETTLVFISMVAWNGCLTKKRIRNDKNSNKNRNKCKNKSNIQLIGKRVTVVSVFMIGLAEYVTLLDSELMLHARPVSDETIICEEESQDPP